MVFIMTISDSREGSVLSLMDTFKNFKFRKIALAIAMRS